MIQRRLIRQIMKKTLYWTSESQKSIQAKRYEKDYWGEQEYSKKGGVCEGRGGEEAQAVARSQNGDVTTIWKELFRREEIGIRGPTDGRGPGLKRSGTGVRFKCTIPFLLQLYYVKLVCAGLQSGLIRGKGGRRTQLLDIYQTIRIVITTGHEKQASKCQRKD